MEIQNGKQIVIVEQTTYLRQVMAMKRQMEKEINSWTTRTWRTGWYYAVTHWSYTVTHPHLYSIALHYCVTLDVCTNLDHRPQPWCVIFLWCNRKYRLAKMGWCYTVMHGSYTVTHLHSYAMAKITVLHYMYVPTSCSIHFS